MLITIRLLAGYRRYVPEGLGPRAEFPIEVRPGTTIRQVLLELPIPADSPCTFLVNGRHAVRDQVVEDGDVLAVFPAVGGG